MPAMPNLTFHGKVTRIADALQPGTRTLLTEVDVPNPGGALQPGVYCTVELKSPTPIAGSDRPRLGNYLQSERDAGRGGRERNRPSAQDNDHDGLRHRGGSQRRGQGRRPNHTDNRRSASLTATRYRSSRNHRKRHRDRAPLVLLSPSPRKRQSRAGQVRSSSPAPRHLGRLTIARFKRRQQSRSSFTACMGMSIRWRRRSPPAPAKPAPR